MSKNNKAFKTSLALNQKAFLLYYDTLKDIATSSFKWHNLPDTVNERYLERTLYYNGHVAFFEDDVVGYLALASSLSGSFDVYGDPTNVLAYGQNGYNVMLNTYNECVVIYNNVSRTDTDYICVYYANMLYQIDRIIQVNLNQQKTPCIVQCDDNQRFTMENLFKRVDGNEHIIFGNKALDLKAATVLDLKAEYKADKMHDLKQQVWNDAMTALGVSNVIQTKKERQISDEVMRGMGGVFANRYTRLKTRQLACETINDRYGLDISVEFIDVGANKEVDNIGTVHDTNQGDTA